VRSVEPFSENLRFLHATRSPTFHPPSSIFVFFIAPPVAFNSLWVELGHLVESFFLDLGGPPRVG